MKNRCTLCLNFTKFKGSQLCTNCFCQIQNLQWSSCARCGKQDCSGCNQIANFNKVTSAYSYSNVLAQLLNLSKESNNKNCQIVFHELFFIPIKNALLELIKNNNYDIIVLAPLRKERIFNGNWHPNIFFYEILNFIQNHNLELYILCPYFASKKKKQSLIPTFLRKKLNLDLSSYKLIYSELNDDKNTRNTSSEILNNNSKRILLLDDVLTTGRTALLTYELSHKYFPNSQWDLFTIFRAPQSKL